MNIINNTFLKLSKRAETRDSDYLVKTFVNVGPLFTILSNRDHEILYGRRGTGKTHALTYLSDSLKSNKNNIVINIDLRTIGSNGGIFSDNSLPLKERATRLLIDTFTYIIDGIIDDVINDSENKFDLSKISPIADRLWEAISEITIGEDVSIEKSKIINQKNIDNSQGGFELSTSKVGFNYSVGNNEESADSNTINEIRQGREFHRIHFSSIFKNFQQLANYLGVHIWIIFDEWAEIPQELQPYLAELIRRTILPNSGVTVKIAAIDQRTNLSIFDTENNRIGIEIGADIAASQNLDEYMVFDNDELKAMDFFKELLYHHFRGIASMEEIIELNILKSEDLINAAFTQINTFSEFVRASEGVPRDAINILGIAAMKAADSKISMEHIRTAARIWYSRGKEKAISTHDKAYELLRWIRDEVIGKRNARAFLLQTNQKDPLIEYLFDSRVLHIIKDNVSGKDTPGVRYNVYSIDYGCYVDLMNTANAPKGLFEAIEEETGNEDSIYVDVPKNDYRAIRRAILNLDEFYHNVA